VGGFAPVYIGRKIADNRFQIAGGTPGLEVSWTVTAQRNDRYVQRHGAPVEQEKPPEYRGKYLQPELWGQPKEMQERYRERPDFAKGASPTASGGVPVKGAPALGLGDSDSGRVVSPTASGGAPDTKRVQPVLPKQDGGGR